MKKESTKKPYKGNGIPLKVTDIGDLKYIDIPSEYGTTGRWFRKTLDGIECLASINIGSELYFKVTGTSSLILNFKQINSQVMPAIVYWIDEEPKVKVQVTTDPMTIASNLDTSEEHFIRIKVEGIKEGDSVWIDEEGLIFSGAVVDNGGVISGIKPINKRILFFGDSITAGLSVYRPEEVQPMSHGGSVNYAAVCTQKLNAVDIRVAFGCTGIVHVGPNSIPNAFGYLDYMTETKEETGEFPDLIVVNYGTNDASDDQTEEFVIGYPSFLDKLADKYNGVPVFAVVPFNQARAKEIKSAVEEMSNVLLVDTASWNYTGETHPNASDSKWLGENLADEILDVLGEEFFK